MKGKRIAILLESIYEDAEFWYPYYRLKEAGAQVDAVAPEKKKYFGKYGYPAAADLSAKEADAAKYDGVIIPGGYAPDHMRRHPEMISFLKEIFDNGKVVAAICHGPWMLVSVDALKGRTVTGFFAIKDDITNAGAEFVDRNVVRDGNVITSRKPSDLPDFSKEILNALSEV